MAHEAKVSPVWSYGLRFQTFFNWTRLLRSTWMDEDAIKRWFRIKKRVHKRNATLNCLRRWLLALPGQLQKACAKDNWDDFPKFSFWCGLKVKKIYHFFCSMLLSQAYWLTLKRPCTHICLEKNGFPNEFGMVFVEFTSADFMGIYDGIRNLYVC